MQLRVRGLRKDASTLSKKNVLGEIDLSMARFGRKIFPVTREQIRLPSDRVYVVNI